ncbi:uncharacterized protein LOC135092888 [Scylla paramamosain]|uniref:uncharacterized protein LOC135092888 n=1 Tax=Scylla paramamosain TaxID=85552 RepID=UPI003083B00E
MLRHIDTAPRYWLTRMVTSQASAHLLALLVCCSFLPQSSDGAKLYGHPRHLDYEALLDDPPTAEAAYDWGASRGQEVGGGGEGAMGGGVGVYLPPPRLIEEDRPLPPPRDDRPPYPFLP